VSALDAAGLGKRHRRTWALRDCTLRIPEGRVVALVGANGAGKTTLLHLAVGLIRPTEGRISVLDGLAPGTDAARAAMSFVAQDAPLYPGLSVHDTLRLTAELSRRFDVQEARSRLTGLGIPLGARVGTLSGGQHAQVALAVALARHPRLILLDEPLARLDPLARHGFMSTLMTAVADTGLSVVFSSHVVAELQRVCDHLILLAGGRVQLAGDVEDLLADHCVLTGPTADAGRLSPAVPVVLEERAGRQTRALVRSGRRPVPAGWRAEPTNLEELVLGYLRAPDASALPGPQGSARAGRVEVTA
jgi:ABC-2 type transport system ATP-binding protein